eukprot:1036869-Rhodomonas_salina.4
MPPSSTDTAISSSASYAPDPPPTCSNRGSTCWWSAPTPDDDLIARAWWRNVVGQSPRVLGLLARGLRGLGLKDQVVVTLFGAVQVHTGKRGLRIIGEVSQFWTLHVP